MLRAWGPRVCPQRLAYTVQSVEALWGGFGILCWVKVSWLGVHLIPTFRLDGVGGEVKQSRENPPESEMSAVLCRVEGNKGDTFSLPASRRFRKSCILFWFVYVTLDAGSCHCLQTPFRYDSPPGYASLQPPSPLSFLPVWQQSGVRAPSSLFQVISQLTNKTLFPMWDTGRTFSQHWMYKRFVFSS